MAQVVPTTGDEDGALIGLAKQLATGMEKGTRPFVRYMTLEAGNILFQRVGEMVRAIVTAGSTSDTVGITLPNPVPYRGVAIGPGPGQPGPYLHVISQVRTGGEDEYKITRTVGLYDGSDRLLRSQTGTLTASLVPPTGQLLTYVNYCLNPERGDIYNGTSYASGELVGNYDRINITTFSGALTALNDTRNFGRARSAIVATSDGQILASSYTAFPYSDSTSDYVIADNWVGGNYVDLFHYVGATDGRPRFSHKMQFSVPEDCIYPSDNDALPALDDVPLHWLLVSGVSNPKYYLYDLNVTGLYDPDVSVHRIVVRGGGTVAGLGYGADSYTFPAPLGNYPTPTQTSWVVMVTAPSLILTLQTASSYTVFAQGDASSSYLPALQAAINAAVVHVNALNVARYQAAGRVVDGQVISWESRITDELEKLLYGAKAKTTSLVAHNTFAWRVSRVIPAVGVDTFLSPTQITMASGPLSTTPAHGEALYSAVQSAVIQVNAINKAILLAANSVIDGEPIADWETAVRDLIRANLEHGAGYYMGARVSNTWAVERSSFPTEHLAIAALSRVTYASGSAVDLTYFPALYAAVKAAIPQINALNEIAVRTNPRGLDAYASYDSARGSLRTRKKEWFKKNATATITQLRAEEVPRNWDFAVKNQAPTSDHTYRAAPLTITNELSYYDGAVIDSDYNTRQLNKVTLSYDFEGATKSTVIVGSQQGGNYKDWYLQYGFHAFNTRGRQIGGVTDDKMPHLFLPDKYAPTEDNPFVDLHLFWNGVQDGDYHADSTFGYPYFEGPGGATFPFFATNQLGALSPTFLFGPAPYMNTLVGSLPDFIKQYLAEVPIQYGVGMGDTAWNDSATPDGMNVTLIPFAPVVLGEVLGMFATDEDKEGSTEVEIYGSAVFTYSSDSGAFSFKRWVPLSGADLTRRVEVPSIPTYNCIAKYDSIVWPDVVLRASQARNARANGGGDRFMQAVLDAL